MRVDIREPTDTDMPILEDVRKIDAKQAILFSANEYASRASRGIGFEQIGHYTLTMFAKPETKE